MTDRSFMDRDAAGHWYIIPVAHRDDWNGWVDLDEDDEEAWHTPSYAARLSTSPSAVEFSNDYLAKIERKS